MSTSKSKGKHPFTRIDNEKAARVMTILDSLKSEKKPVIQVSFEGKNEGEISKPRGSWWPFKK